MGLAGFPGSGKTTIFNALTGLHADVGLGASAAGKPNLGAIKVPDPRVDALAEIFSPKKKTYAEITFVDFPDPTAEGGRLDERVIAQMRGVDAFAHVVRAFDDPAQPSPDPRGALESFRAELIVADLAVVERRLERLKRERGNEQERDLLGQLVHALGDDVEIRRLGLPANQEVALAGFGFLTLKPRLVVLNVNEAALREPPAADVAAAVERDGLRVLMISGKVEMELAELEPEERREFERELGLAESARDRFIRASYRLLDLTSFLTAGEDEVRAWTIRRGDNAHTAAGKIHSDIARGFIRAEVIPVEALVELKSEARCREAGRLRLEGKDYVVQDGDVVHFRFNV